jgi:hypothetical protein
MKIEAALRYVKRPGWITLRDKTQGPACAEFVSHFS